MKEDSQKEMRKEMFDRMEAELQKTCKPEERMFALHPDEEHIIVSHALFLMMSKPLAVKLPSLKGLYLLRKLEEEMLTAYLTESDGFPELLRYCNLLYEVFPYELAAAALMQPQPLKSGSCRVSQWLPQDMAAIWMMTQWMTFLTTWTLTATVRCAAT